MTPAQYWQSKVRYSDFSVDYYFVDSNVWDASAVEDDSHAMCSPKHNTKDAKCGVDGPQSLEDCPGWFQRLWAEQIVWLDRVLAQSEADWQVVVTHFPPSWGQQEWARLSAEHGIDLFVAGHEHRQSVEYPSTDLGLTGVSISGGGGGITSEGLPDVGGEDDQYGFIDLTLTKSEIRIEADRLPPGNAP